MKATTKIVVLTTQTENELKVNDTVRGTLHRHGQRTYQFTQRKAQRDCMPEAKILAEKALADLGMTSGKFEHAGHHYTLDLALVFDIIGKPQKYTMPEGVEYRRMAVEQAEYKRQAAKLTPKMKTIMDDFPGDHPNIIPDVIIRTLKCWD